MSFVVKEVDVVRLVMGYLKNSGCFEALNALALEADTSFEELPDGLIYMQRLVLQGRWDVVVKYLDTLRNEASIHHIINQLDYAVHRQKYLELLSWQGGGVQRMAFPPWRPTDTSSITSGKADGKELCEDENNIEMSTLVKELNTLKPLCSAAEFNALCAFLTLDRLEAHPDFQNWTVARGRWACFEELSSALAPILATEGYDAGNGRSTSDGRSGLLKTIAMSLAYQTALALDQPFAEHQREQAAHFDHSAGYIVSAHKIGQDEFASFDDSSTPSLLVQSPLQFLHRFDATAALPQVNPAQSDHRHNRNVAVEKDSPSYVVNSKQAVPSPQGRTEERPPNAPLLSVPSGYTPIQPPAAADHHPQGWQQSEVYSSPALSTALAPSLFVPQPGYVYAVPPGYQQHPNVFGFLPAGVLPPATTQLPAAMHHPHFSSSAQRLSIEVGDGPRVDQHRDAALQQPQQALTSQQPAAAYPAPVAASTHYAPTDSFTPQTVLPGNYFQPQTAYYTAGHPSAHQPEYPPNSLQFQSPHASPQVAPTQPSSVNIPVCSGQTDVVYPTKAPGVWTAGQGGVASAAANSRVPQSVPKQAEVVVAPPAVFTVPVVDEAKVKQMPAALRRKMEADKEAAALVAEERQQESLQAERAASRSRSRSAPRGNAPASTVPVTIATPSSSARPQSALRSRVGQSPEQLSVPASTRNGAADPRKSSESAISKFSNQSQPSQAGSVRSGGASRIPTAAAPGVHTSDNTSSSVLQRKGAVPTLPAEKNDYSSHVLYESKCPLRCVSVLGGGPARTQFAVGSNAKAILTMSYARGEVEADRSVRDSVVIDREMNGAHNGSVYCTDYHAGLGLIASGSNDKAIRFCSPTTGQFGEAMKEHTGTIRVVKFLSEGSGGAALLASAGAGDCKPRLWDAQAGRFVRAMSEHPDAIHGLAWVNETLFVTGCDAGVIVGHDLRSSRPAWSYSLSDALPPGAGGQKGICCLSLFGGPHFSAGSSASVPMVAGGLGGFVTLFNAASGQIFSHEKLHSDDVRSVSVLPGTSRTRGEISADVLTGSYDGTAAVWRVCLDPTNKVRYDGSPRVLTGHADKVLGAVQFFAGGRSAPDVLTTGADGKVILWTLPQI